MARLSRTTRSEFRRGARKIRRMADEIGKRTGAGMRGIGEEIMTDVKASRPGKGVPRDLGPLAASGAVRGPDSADRVTLSFGGPAGSGNVDNETNREDVGYAVVQHEDVSLAHDVGESRYLVRGVERWEPGGSAAVRALKENAEAGIKAAARS